MTIIPKKLLGDCRQTLKTLPDASVHCCITSPPYWGLRSYLPKDHPLKPLEIGSEPTMELYLQHLLEVFAEVKRVLRDDGTCWKHRLETLLQLPREQSSPGNGPRPIQRHLHHRDGGNGIGSAFGAL